MDRYLTFLYVRRGNAGVRSFRIHRLLAMLIVGVIVVLIGSAVTFIARYSQHVVNEKQLAELQRENGALTKKIETFRIEMEELKALMEKNFELQDRMRLIASMEPLPMDVREVGVGGPEPMSQSREAAVPEIMFAGLDQDLEKLVRQSQLQFESYQEVIAMLEKDQMIRDCTPSIRPLKGGFLSSRYGRRMDPFTGRIALHQGVDYRARTGSTVVSTADGVVTLAKKNGSFGLVVEVNHGNGFKTRYAHLSKMLVRRGQRVKRGESIGLVGNTGRSTGSHLHYEVIFGKTHRDPLQYVIPEGEYYD